MHTDLFQRVRGKTRLENFTCSHLDFVVGILDTISTLAAFQRAWPNAGGPVILRLFPGFPGRCGILRPQRGSTCSHTSDLLKQQ